MNHFYFVFSFLLYEIRISVLIGPLSNIHLNSSSFCLLCAESVRDALGRKVKLSLRRRVKLEIKGDKTENRVLVSQLLPLSSYFLIKGSEIFLSFSLLPFLCSGNVPFSLQSVETEHLPTANCFFRFSYTLTFEVISHKSKSEIVGKQYSHLLSRLVLGLFEWSQLRERYPALTGRVCLFVYILIFLTTAHPMDFDLGRCVAVSG